MNSPTPPVLDRSRALMALFLCAGLWSMGGLLIKLVPWNAFSIAGARGLIVVVVMLLVGFRPKFVTAKPFLVGVACVAITNSSYILANQLTYVANAMVLQYTAPIYVALLSRFLLGTELKLFDWLCVGATILGIALFFLDHLGPGDGLGNMIALGSGVALAGLYVSLQMQQQGNPQDCLFYGNFLLAVGCLPFLVREQFFAPGTQYVLVLGLFQQALPTMLYGFAARYVTALDTALITTLNPILGSIWPLIALGELPGPWSRTGIAIVFAAVVARSVRKVGS